MQTSVEKHLTSTRSPRSLRWSFSRMSFCLFALVLMTACGGGAGDTQPVSSKPSTELSDNADSVSTADMQRAASVGSKQMQDGFGNMERFAEQPMRMNSFAGSMSDWIGFSGRTSLEGDNNITGESYDQTEAHIAEPGIWEQGGVNELIDIALGLQGGADLTRNGNRVTVNPDNAQLCERLLPELQARTQEDQLFCEQMVADVLIHIDAQTESSGKVTVEFQQNPLFILSYNENSSAVEVRLNGFLSVITKANALNPSRFSELPEVLEGIIKIQTHVDNSDGAGESGAFSLVVSSPVKITENSVDFNLFLDASELMSIQYNNAAGTASIAMDAGAFNVSFFDGRAYELVSGGSSVHIDLENDGEQVQVSRLGFGNGPLLVSVDSIEVIRMTLDSFGFDIDSVAEQLTLTGQLNFNLMVDLWHLYSGFSTATDTNSAGLGALQLSVQAPESALFKVQPNGSVMLDQAGPLNIDLNSGYPGGSRSATFIANPGDCFIPSESNGLFSTVEC